MTRRSIPQGWLLFAVGLIAVASLLLAPSLAWAEARGASGPGGVGVRLLDAATATSGDPRAGLYIIDHVAPGSVIERRIEVTNTTVAPAAIQMYAAGASVADGTFMGDAGGTPNELSRWNVVDPGVLDLDANDSAIVTVRITVPSDASPGERYAAVWAEVRSDTAPHGVEQVNRVGIRQYVSVGPGGPPAADFTIDSLTASRAADGAPLVLATVHNTGGRALDMAGELALHDGPGGLSAGPFPARLGSTLAIDESGHVAIPLDEQIPDGPWQAEIALRSGLLDRSAQATLTFPRAGSVTTPAPATPQDPRWPFLLVTGVLLAVLCAALLLAFTRRHRETPPGHDSDADEQLVSTAGSTGR